MTDLIKRLRKAAIFHPGEETQVIGGLLDTCKEAADALERIGWNTDMEAARGEGRVLGFFPNGHWHYVECVWMPHKRFAAGGYFHSLIYAHPTPTKWMHLPPEGDG